MLGTTKHCYILNIQALGFVVSEKRIFHVFPVVLKPMVDNDAPAVWPIWAPGAYGGDI